MFSTLKKWFIGRPLKSGAESEGGLLGKMQALAMLSSDALSSIAYGPEQVILVLTDRFSGSHLVVHSNWDCGPGSPSQFNDFLSSGHSSLPSRGRSLYGDFGEPVSQSGVDSWWKSLG